MNKPIFRRISAYLIDILIITVISGFFVNIEILNPYAEKYNKISEESTEYIQNASADKLFTDEKLLDYSYELSYYGIYTSIITLVISIIYFVGFQYFNGGKTIGKAFTKIKVVSSDNKKPKFYQILIRSTIINSLLTCTLLILFVAYLSRKGFETGSTIVQMIDLGLLFACAIMILARQDGKGLHDILANTQVINIKKEQIKEANIKESTRNIENTKKVVKKKKDIKKEQ